MKNIQTGFFQILLLSLTFVSCDLLDNRSGTPSNEDIWVNAYLVSWQHNPETEQINSGIIKTDEIDWEAMTHLTYFALQIAGDGTPALSLDPEFRNNFNSDRLQAIVPAAHEQNIDIIFSVGGGGNYDGFSSAISDTNRARLVQTITHIILTYGFDGVNLNMIPIEPEDFTNYRAFVRQLSAVFDTMKTRQNNRPFITAAASNTEQTASLFNDLQQYFDQINILTLDMAQPWRGWLAWHNSALYNNRWQFENSSEHLPSINQKVNDWIAAGIERKKIGIALNFYGSVWNEVNLLDKWASWPTQDMSIYDTQPYSMLNADYDLSKYEWDKEARVPYLNLTDPPGYISFDNEESIIEKMEYAKSNRLGGVMVWDISADFSRTSTPHNLLLQTVKSQLNK